MTADGTATIDPLLVDGMRSFTRFYTARLGVLDEGLLDTRFSVTEARIVFELAQRDATDVADLRRELRVDAGYMSRITARLEREGLVRRERSEGDARRVTLRLTDEGRAAFADLDARSAAQVAGALTELDEPVRRRVVAAMDTIRAALAEGAGDRATRTVVLRAPRAGELGWIVARHGALYAQEYGWNDEFEGLVARVVADYVEQRDPRRSAAWIAEVEGAPAGCVLCVPSDGAAAKLRLLLVEPTARGLGIGSRLVDECVRFARHAGYGSIVLWTNDVLVAARRIYEAAGFTLVDEERHHSFGRDLVGQNWALDLGAEA
jgi:DNA-binding MarR family transcriptional regulator/N-acetylglutamate synthase-like GNAT family acetyltransferase